ncbi:hypothetical protein BpHYR1_021483 [Brachionus plicatilis]|uniref:Uncharacterized protein n=1 Tax=Brachionus plicatilis TaxID=10195 RepID=A0A3M7PU82_BRAPC|nr:hypothetical protein BpHYR1_021483 [Brachionus plicatilis]
MSSLRFEHTYYLTWFCLKRQVLIPSPSLKTLNHELNLKKSVFKNLFIITKKSVRSSSFKATAPKEKIKI